MALDFPTSPTNGQQFQGYVYSSALTAWQAKPSAQSPFYTSDTPPLNPVIGDAWFNTNDGTMYIYFNDGNTSQWVEHRSEIARSQVGLVPIVPTSVSVGSGTGSVDLLGNVTFTGVSSVSLNGVFSSAFRNYRLVLNVPTSSADTAITFRYRVGTTDNSTSTYFVYQTWKRTTGVIQDNSGGPLTTGTFINRLASQSWGSWAGEIYNPNLATTTHVAGVGFGGDATSSFAIWNGTLFNANTVFDGITIFAATGTMAGSVKIYGYN